MFEYCLAKVPFIELATELVQINLKVLQANGVIDILQQPLCIGNRNVHPRQHLVNVLSIDELWIQSFTVLLKFVYSFKTSDLMVRS